MGWGCPGLPGLWQPLALAQLVNETVPILTRKKSAHGRRSFCHSRPSVQPVTMTEKRTFRTFVARRELGKLGTLL